MYMRGALFVNVTCARKWCLVWTFVALVILYNVKSSSVEEVGLRIDMTQSVALRIGGS